MKIIILKIWLLKPCETLWYPVKISWAKINLQRISVTNKNLKSPLYSRFSIIFEKYGVWFSGLRISFLLLKLKNPRSRSRRVCLYFMKKSRFLHGLSTLQRVLIYDHRLRSYSWMTEKKTLMEWISLHRTKIEGGAPKISLEQKYFFSPSQMVPSTLCSTGIAI